MSTRTLTAMVIVLGGTWVVGCQPSADTKLRPEMAGHSPVVMPTIPDLTMEHAAGDGRDIGAASYCVPSELDGTRRRLTIFACDT